VRLIDIAARAGVSQATVSRVLNGRPGVTAATHDRVRAAVTALGEPRPPAARPAARGLVGLITPALHNPVFPAFTQAIAQGLLRHGYHPVLCPQDPEAATEDDLVRTLLDENVAGIVFLYGMHSDHAHGTGRYQRLSDRGMPFVLINGYREGIAAPFVTPDESVGMKLAVQHLAQLGHVRIGLSTGPDRYVPARRMAAGFTAALAGTVGLPPGDAARMTEHSLWSVEGGHVAAGRLLERGCTAIVCGSDQLAIGAIRAARLRGLHVPGDVSVIGFDDSPLIAYTDPPLTTLRQPVEAMGIAAVQALADQIGGHPAGNAEFTFAPELVARGSTGSAPGRRPA
jgi:DNA-binding LacI/PurR family transcriptional regulator